MDPPSRGPTFLMSAIGLNLVEIWSLSGVFFGLRRYRRIVSGADVGMASIAVTSPARLGSGLRRRSTVGLGDGRAAEPGESTVVASIGSRIEFLAAVPYVRSS